MMRRRRFVGLRRSTPYGTGAGGFTLIEVLVSLAIFALAAVVLSAAYLNVLGSYRAIGERQRTDEEWKLLRLAVISEPERAKVEAGGSLRLADGREVPWTARVESTEVADLFRVVLDGEAPSGNGAEAWRRQQVLHLLRPSWSDPAEREELRERSRQRLAAKRDR